MLKRSDYYSRLQGPVKERYDDKISCIRKLDPYALLTGFCNEWSKFPDLTSDAVCHYLVHSVSFYTFEEFHAQKSLGAVNFVASDKVSNLRVRKIDQMYLIRAKVKHSYKDKATPLDVWVITNDIQVVSSHCNCVAGLREGCSHVGAVLFSIMFGRGQLKSVTDVAAYWVVPAGVEKAEQKRLKDIDFATPEKIMRRKLGLECEPTPKKVFRPEASSEEFNLLLKGLWDQGEVGAIHLVTEPYAGTNRKALPHSLLELYDRDHEKLSLEDLRQLGEATPIGWTKEERQLVAKLTIGQSVKRFWYLIRAGLVRGSLMKRCCRTDPLNPSVSLLKQVCYPHLSKFKTAATVYGCDHEEKALKAYLRQVRSKHVNFQTHKSGFNICEEVQFVGSSTDGFVSCDCHGRGCIEVKCPHCLRDASAEEILSAKTCLETVLDEASGSLVSTLKKDSDYYYQVQTELFSSGTTYCDFVLWTPKAVYIQRIHQDLEAWSLIKDKASRFFKMAVMPELLAKFYTRKAAEEEKQRVTAIKTPGVVPKGLPKLPKKKEARTVLGQLQPQAQPLTLIPAASSTATPLSVPPSIPTPSTSTVSATPVRVPVILQCRKQNLPTPSPVLSSTATPSPVLSSRVPTVSATPVRVPVILQCRKQNLPTPSPVSSSTATPSPVLSSRVPTVSATPVRVPTILQRRKQNLFFSRVLKME